VKGTLAITQSHRYSAPGAWLALKLLHSLGRRLSSDGHPRMRDRWRTGPPGSQRMNLAPTISQLKHLILGLMLSSGDCLSAASSSLLITEIHLRTSACTGQVNEVSQREQSVVDRSLVAGRGVSADLEVGCAQLLLDLLAALPGPVPDRVDPRDPGRGAVGLMRAAYPAVIARGTSRAMKRTGPSFIQRMLTPFSPRSGGRHASLHSLGLVLDTDQLGLVGR
jgi:hypothetical protein